jgi:hypothetical protein
MYKYRKHHFLHNSKMQRIKDGNLLANVKDKSKVTNNKNLLESHPFGWLMGAVWTSGLGYLWYKTGITPTIPLNSGSTLLGVGTDVIDSGVRIVADKRTNNNNLNISNTETTTLNTPVGDSVNKTLLQRIKDRTGVSWLLRKLSRVKDATPPSVTPNMDVLDVNSIESKHDVPDSHLTKKRRHRPHIRKNLGPVLKVSISCENSRILLLPSPWYRLNLNAPNIGSGNLIQLKPIFQIQPMVVPFQPIFQIQPMVVPLENQNVNVTIEVQVQDDLAANTEQTMNVEVEEISEIMQDNLDGVKDKDLTINFTSTRQIISKYYVEMLDEQQTKLKDQLARDLKDIYESIKEPSDELRPYLNKIDGIDERKAHFLAKQWTILYNTVGNLKTTLKNTQDENIKSDIINKINACTSRGNELNRELTGTIKGMTYKDYTACLDKVTNLKARIYELEHLEPQRLNLMTAITLRQNSILRERFMAGYTAYNQDKGLMLNNYKEIVKSNPQFIDIPFNLISDLYDGIVLGYTAERYGLSNSHMVCYNTLRSKYLDSYKTLWQDVATVNNITLNPKYIPTQLCSVSFWGDLLVQSENLEHSSPMRTYFSKHAALELHRCSYTYTGDKPEIDLAISARINLSQLGVQDFEIIKYKVEQENKIVFMHKVFNYITLDPTLSRLNQNNFRTTFTNHPGTSEQAFAVVMWCGERKLDSNMDLLMYDYLRGWSELAVA